MGDNVIINLNDLNNFIHTLDQFNHVLGDESSRLQGNFNQLGESWRDDAYQRFAGYFEQLVANLRQFQQVTEEDTLPYLAALKSRIEDVLSTYR